MKSDDMILPAHTFEDKEPEGQKQRSANAAQDLQCLVSGAHAEIAHRY
jgi:hypothetical protein